METWRLELSWGDLKGWWGWGAKIVPKGAVRNGAGGGQAGATPRKVVNVQWEGWR